MKEKKNVRRGTRMKRGKQWRLFHGQRMFAGALLQTINLGHKRLAIFSVWKDR